MSPPPADPPADRPDTRAATRADGTPLRYGWTTGACATAAATAAYQALLTGDFPDPVEVRLPKDRRPSFALATESLSSLDASAGVIKDAGDDPDVTHGALVVATVRHGTPGSGVTFMAGAGVGTVTKPGLPLPVGEPAINPVPRQLIRDAVARVAASYGGTGDVVVEIGIRDGERLAEQTWNPRLGILGGLSVLGTTGVVVPYSCSAWIDSIRRGVDVARAVGHRHVAGAVGATSEKAVMAFYGLPQDALLDMGDFAGAVLKYVRRNPVERLTIAGGFGKICKLAAGHLDLHSGRSQVDVDGLADALAALGAPASVVAQARAANTALEVLRLSQAADVDLASEIARRARAVALEVLRDAPISLDILITDPTGTILATAP